MNFPYYFNHIPKTAGTSFRHSISQIFNTNRTNGYWFIDDYLRDSRERLLSYEILAGHFGGFPLSMHPRSLRVITFLRNPIERSYSHFRHIRNTSGHPFSSVVNEMSFTDFIHSDLSEHELLSFQTRFVGLSGVDDIAFLYGQRNARKSNVHVLRGRQLLQKSLVSLSKYFYVGIVERYRDSVDQLSRLMGVPLENDSQWNRSGSDEQLPSLSRGDIDRLEWLNEFDFILYRLAGKLNEQLALQAERGASSPIKYSAHYFRNHVDLMEGWVGGGWRPIEQFSNGCYTWSSNMAPWLGFLLAKPQNLVFSCRAATYFAKDIEGIKVKANGEEVDFDVSPCPAADGNSFHYLWCKVPKSLIGYDNYLEIRFVLNRAVNPKRDLGLEDDRDLGLYLNWARIAA